jgi:hypothetical protein
MVNDARVGSKTWLLLTYGVIGESGYGFVLVDETVEDSSPSDPVGRENGWRQLEWLRRPTVQGPVGPVLVVVRQAHGEYCSQVTFMPARSTSSSNPDLNPLPSRLPQLDIHRGISP